MCDLPGLARSAADPGRSLPLLVSVPLLVLLALIQAHGQVTWAPPIRISQEVGTSSTVLVVDAGYRIHLIHTLLNTFINYQQWDARYANGAFDLSRQAQEAITGQYKLTTNYALAEDSTGAVHAVIGLDTPATCLMYVPITIDGPGAPEPIGVGGCVATQNDPFLAADRAGLLHLVYEESGQIYYRRRRPTGEWSPAVNISNSVPAFERRPTIVVAPNGSLAVTYHADSQTGGMLRFVRGTVTGASVSFSPPVDVVRALGSSAVPMLFDPDGAGHVVIPAESADNVSTRAVLHMVYRDGIWTDPDTVVAASSEGGFEEVQSAIDPVGDLHVVVIDTTASDGNVGELLYITNRAGGWSSPLRLVVDSSIGCNIHGALAIRDSLIVLAYHAGGGVSSMNGYLFVGVIGFPPALSVDPDTIDFGDVPVLSCESRGYVARNWKRYSSEPLRLDRAIAIGSESEHFIVNSVAGVRITAADSVTEIARFCPRAVGRFQAILMIEGNGGIDSIVLIGHGTTGDVEPRSRELRLDTVETDVGDRVALSCAIDPPLRVADDVQSFRIDLLVDQQALFPHSVQSLNASIPSEHISMEYSSGRATVRGWAAPGDRITGDTLFRIQVEGLLTGRPENIVAFDTVNLQSPITITTGSGLVRLSGCEVGGVQGLGRRATIDAIFPNPSSDIVTIRYYVPAGVEPQLTVSDLPGMRRAVTVLPESTGTVRATTLSLREYPPGVYLVRIVAGAEQASTVVTITR